MDKLVGYLIGLCALGALVLKLCKTIERTQLLAWVDWGWVLYGLGAFASLALMGLPIYLLIWLVAGLWKKA